MSGLFKIPVGDNEAVAIFLCALQSDSSSGSTSTENHDAQITKIDRKFLPNRASKSLPIGVVTVKFRVNQFNGVNRPNPPGMVIDSLHEFAARYLVWCGQVHADKVRLTDHFERALQFFRQNLEARVLHVDFARLQGRVLHLR